jgi:2-keto-4-pentenoate hydratase/2-oxohepta-3-ene-1,7-dioic acid hydratase in catechol pathway
MALPPPLLLGLLGPLRDLATDIVHVDLVRPIDVAVTDALDVVAGYMTSHDVSARSVAFASSFTLEPGDVIETGTPAGCGSVSGTFLHAGDLMTARVGNLGELRTPVTADH